MLKRVSLRSSVVALLALFLVGCSEERVITQAESREPLAMASENSTHGNAHQPLQRSINGVDMRIDRNATGLTTASSKSAFDLIDSPKIPFEYQHKAPKHVVAAIPTEAIRFAFVDSEHYLIFDFENGLRLINTLSGETVAKLPDNSKNAVFSNDLRHVLCLEPMGLFARKGNRLRLLVSNQPQFTGFVGEFREAECPHISVHWPFNACFSYDGTYCAVAGWDPNAIAMVNTENGSSQVLKGVGLPVAFSEDRRAFYCFSENHLLTYNLEAGTFSGVSRHELPWSAGHYSPPCKESFGIPPNRVFVDNRAVLWSSSEAELVMTTISGEMIKTHWTVSADIFTELSQNPFSVLAGGSRFLFTAGKDELGLATHYLYGDLDSNTLIPIDLDLYVFEVTSMDPSGRYAAARSRQDQGAPTWIIALDRSSKD